MANWPIRADWSFQKGEEPEEGEQIAAVVDSIRKIIVFFQSRLIYKADIKIS